MKGMKMKQESNFIVYKATNLETNEVYIGSTTSTLDTRKKDHIQKANKGNGHFFQEAIGTYGPEAFQWEEIDTASSINELAEKEREYIFKYNSKEEGYNCDSGGGFKKSIYQYSLDGNLVAEYESLSCAANAVNAGKKAISNTCLGYNNSCKGYYWSYLCKDEFKVQDKRKKEVFQYDLEGNLLAKYISASEASRKTGVSKSCITKCCRGERKSSNNFIWRYTS